MASTITRQECEYCGSNNNICFFLNKQGEKTSKCMTPNCKYNLIRTSIFPVSNEELSQMSQIDLIISGPADLHLRNISSDTVAMYNYKEGTYNSTQCQIAIYEDGAMQCRLPNKIFPWVGHNSTTPLWGINIIPDLFGTVIITEGQIDAMSVYEATGHIAYSLPGGIDSGDKAILDSRIQNAEKVILWMDNDEAGKIGLEKYKKLIPLGKCFYVDNFPYKDANEALMQDDKQAIKDAINNAKELIPEGIIFGKDLDSKEFLKKLPKGYKIGLPLLDDMTRGFIPGRLYSVSGGPGIGKSTFLRMCVSKLRELYDLSVANIFLEEDQRITALAYIALKYNIKIGDFIQNPLEYITQKQYDDAWKDLIANNKMMFHDAKSSISSVKFLKEIEYLVTVKKYQVVVLDHVALLMGSEKHLQNKVDAIDFFMERLYNLVIQHQFIAIVANQLAKPQGQGWDEGRIPTQNDSRGSMSMVYKPDVMIGLSRNLYQVDPLQITINKNRWFDTGTADKLYVSKETNNLLTIDKIFPKRII